MSSSVDGRRVLGRSIVYAVALVAFTHVIPASEVPTGFQERVLRDETGDHRYTVFVPAAYTPEKKWPTILYLHGAGSRGADNKLPLENGLGPQVRARGASFPFLVVFPQCEDVHSRTLYGWQADTADGRRALQILDAVEKEFSVDRRREILTGWSMGGFGAWSLGAVDPARWSAIFILAGGGEPDVARRLKDVPLWLVHSLSDPGVPMGVVRPMIDAVRQAGGRVHLTELLEARHNIGHAGYGVDAVYEWMLHPLSEPKDEGVIKAARRDPTPEEMGEGALPFVPAAVVPEAIYVHLDQTALDTAAFALPGMVPADALNRAVGDVYDTRKGILTRFDIAISGISYRGTLEQVGIKTHADGWATIDIGLRNMTMEVGSTQIDGRFLSAAAGPMQIVIGHARPVVLSIGVRPYVDKERCRMELRNVQFQISDDNYYVTTPHVSTYGLPILRKRVGTAISKNLVSGAYGKKSEIESQVINTVPALIRQLEEQMDQKFGKTRMFANWPNPKSQPRYKLWPNRLHVDDLGLSFVIGMTVASRDPSSEPRPVRRIERPAVKFDDLPRSDGLHVGVSGGMLEALTVVATDGSIGAVDVRDLVVPEFAALADRERILEAIPDLARYGDHLQVRSIMHAVAPIDFTGGSVTEGSNSTGKQGARLGYTDEIAVQIHGARLVVEINASPEQPQWKPCAQFDIELSQRLRMHVQRPDFGSRMMGMERPGDADLAVRGRFADGYTPHDFTLHAERISALFEEGWRAAGKLDCMQHLPVEDIVLGTARLRLAEVGWCEPFMMKRFVPAATRITNGKQQALVYAIRGPFSDWSGPYTLEPGRSYDLTVPYPVTVRPITPYNAEPETVPMGSHFVIGAGANRSNGHPTAIGATAGNRRE